MCNEQLHDLCFEDDEMDGAGLGVVADMGNAYRVLTLKLRERNCLEDLG
jgi:hypothetical protein